MCIWCLDISEYIEITFLHSVKTNFTIKITVQWGYTATAIRLVRSLSHGEHQLLFGSRRGPFLVCRPMLPMAIPWPLASVKNQCCVRFFCEWWWLRLFPFQQLREASEVGLEGSIAQYDPLCSRYRYPKSSTSLDNFSIATHGDMGIHQFKTHHIYISLYIYIYHYIYISLYI